ncbi:formyltransferase family protein [Kutzneria sp. 744]|uniref:formyltransferase family protein n=1 Tax=Kutzneria sp. (strain 744) TaxID=345341 RepID=UPI0003EEB54D|nr:formyltransferase family protein [Kutzneria sp. 744]EWM19778.1 formyltetrahydrofolate deformylase [Kutzneria sp. 744]
MSTVHVSLTAGVRGDYDVLPALNDWLQTHGGEVIDGRIVTKNSNAHRLKLIRSTFLLSSAGKLAELQAGFTEHVGHLIAEGQRVDPAFDVSWRLSRVGAHRILIMVSKTLYGLYNVLGMYAEGLLGDAHIVGVVSNHRDAHVLDGLGGVPFAFVPTDDKDEAERRLLHMVIHQRVNVIVLARYMQVLSPWLCAELEAAGVLVINLHHGDAIGFPGARPSRQALERGARQIGATVHVATKDLDRGPILDQGFWPVPPAASEQDLTRIQWRGGPLLAETLWAYLSGRVVVCGASAEII